MGFAKFWRDGGIFLPSSLLPVLGAEPLALTMARSFAIRL